MPKEWIRASRLYCSYTHYGRTASSCEQTIPLGGCQNRRTDADRCSYPQYEDPVFAEHFNLVAFDYRGHGLTTGELPEDITYSWKEVADDCIAVLVSCYSVYPDTPISTLMYRMRRASARLMSSLWVRQHPQQAISPCVTRNLSPQLASRHLHHAQKAPHQQGRSTSFSQCVHSSQRPCRGAYTASVASGGSGRQ